MMAHKCVRVAGKDCDACGLCELWEYSHCSDEDVSEDQDASWHCEECGGEAAEDGYYYDVEGTILCGGCVDKLFRKEAAG